MWFVGVGVLLLVLKLLGIAPVEHWAWYWVLSPFLAAFLWWTWADASGYAKKKEMDRMDEKKASRRERQMEALGQGDPNKRKRR